MINQYVETRLASTFQLLWNPQEKITGGFCMVPLGLFFRSKNENQPWKKVMTGNFTKQIPSNKSAKCR